MTPLFTMSRALVALALSIPIYMALWFAPALVVLRGFAPVAALKESFFGCLKNIIPFLIYGVVMMVLGILASVPLALGWLVLGPVAVASVYAGYRDIFGDAYSAQRRSPGSPERRGGSPGASASISYWYLKQLVTSLNESACIGPGCLIKIFGLRSPLRCRVTYMWRFP